VQSRERALIKAIKTFAISDWASKKVLDVGCGSGLPLIELLKFGAGPENLYGVDVLPERIEAAKRLHPSIHFECLNAERLPFPADHFDIVMQYNTFVAINPESRRQMADEMSRVLKPTGLILWYDFRLNHPLHADERGIGKKELGQLFPGFQIWAWPVVIPPPAARLIARASRILCEILEKVPVFCSAYFAVLRRNG
jgi:ubiquinone/menaquinone biosynthesis C-methylase UbiE